MANPDLGVFTSNPCHLAHLLRDDCPYQKLELCSPWQPCHPGLGFALAPHFSEVSKKVIGDLTTSSLPTTTEIVKLFLSRPFPIPALAMSPFKSCFQLFLFSDNLVRRSVCLGVQIPQLAQLLAPINGSDKACAREDVTGGIVNA